MKRGSTGPQAFTLIETVAAIAILSLLTIGVVPFLVETRRALAPRSDSVSVEDLAVFVDETLRDPEWPTRSARGRGTLAGTIDRVNRSVPFERLRSDVPRCDHEWWQFQCGETSVYRWVPLEEPLPESPR